MAKTESVKQKVQAIQVKPETKTPFEKGVVFIGKKGVMAYVYAVGMNFNKNLSEVRLKARGKSISHAVDVAEIIKNQDNSIKVSQIQTATEEVTSEEGRPVRISSIEIVLSK